MSTLSRSDFDEVKRIPLWKFIGVWIAIFIIFTVTPGLVRRLLGYGIGGDNWAESFFQIAWSAPFLTALFFLYRTKFYRQITGKIEARDFAKNLFYLFCVTLLTISSGILGKYFLAKTGSPDLIPENIGTQIVFSPVQNPYLFAIFDVAFTIILVPILEELTFRAFLIGKLTKWVPVAWAVLISTLIFAYLHSNPIYAFLAGAVFGIIFIKYGNLYLNIALHATSNLISFLFSILVVFGVYDPLNLNHLTAELVIGTIVFIFSLVFMVVFVKNNFRFIKSLK